MSYTSYTPPPRRRRRLMSEINVVPYIDVMLVLLIIFMITAPLLNLGVEIELPESAAEPLDTESNESVVLVTVTSNGDLYLNLDGKADLIDSESLIIKMAAFVRRNPDLEVLVGGDQRANYGQVYAVMVYLQQAGVRKVGLMSDPGAQDEDTPAAGH
ncbi:MAG: protein TolR [Gammaproteobacteria bacterium]|jgi:biopolymer transport protein TolR|nr:protein TolR [Gammaproteobacteria bacterium]